MKLYTQPISLEDINAGKRIIRTNIVPHYLPIDESKITTIEVPNFESEGTHTEMVYPEPVVDYWEYDEKIEYSVCYALLSFSEYFKLNKTISEGLGYSLNDATARYDSVIPKLAKVNITYTDEVETYDTLAVLQLTVEVQERFPELLEGLTLVDSYIPCDDVQTELEAVDLTTNSVDWVLNHTAAVGTTLELLQLESEPRSIESDIAVEQLVNEGVTIITVE